MAEELIHTGAAGCGCSACASASEPSEDASIDHQAGTVTSLGKTVWTVDAIGDHLNRTGYAWNGLPGQAVQSDANNAVINFGFHTSQATLAANGYTFVYQGGRYGVPEYFNFAPFSPAQRDAAREAMDLWDDLIAVDLTESAINLADVTFSNLASAPGTQAYAILPQGYVGYYNINAVNLQLAEMAGDVWVSLSQADNLQLDEGLYGFTTLVHEAGHALGLSHPGAYNAGSGLPITYQASAEYAQDTLVYSIMSYFDASFSGANHFDFNVSKYLTASAPLVHDIYAIQQMYGADMTTRTGDTIYGFNSNAGRDSFDFSKTPAPIMAIWDAGGNDTLDASGYATDQIVDLREGRLSSIGGVTLATAPSFEQVNATRAANNMAPISRATYDGNMAALARNPAVGRMTDNVAIAYGAVVENAVGGSGNDLLIGNSASNHLKGGVGNDGLTGGEGDDRLDGGTGADTMIGGTGDDLYIVDNGGDLVTEANGGGHDKVESKVSFTLSDHVEDLVLTGTSPTATLTGTGNGLANVITGQGQGSFHLLGGAGDDSLTGGAANDRLDGGTGADAMTGGAGNDVYFVDDLGDALFEVAGEGVDTALVSVSGYTLADGVDNGVLGGAALDLEGNGLANLLVGNALGNRLDGGAGDDRLLGGDGVDFLTGGAGKDIFVAQINADKVASKSGPVSLDVVLDFQKGSDKIDLSMLDAKLGVEGKQAFSWKGNAANKAAGDLSIRSFGNMNAAEKALGMEIDGVDGDSPFDGPVTLVLGNVDGGEPDFVMAFVKTPGLTIDDFIFADASDGSTYVYPAMGDYMLV